MLTVALLHGTYLTSPNLSCYWWWKQQGHHQNQVLRLILREMADETLSQSLRMWRRWSNKLVIGVGFDKCPVKVMHRVLWEKKEEKQIIQWWCGMRFPGVMMCILGMSSNLPAEELRVGTSQADQEAGAKASRWENACHVGELTVVLTAIVEWEWRNPRDSIRKRKRTIVGREV